MTVSSPPDFLSSGNDGGERVEPSESNARPPVPLLHPFPGKPGHPVRRWGWGAEEGELPYLRHRKALRTLSSWTIIDVAVIDIAPCYIRGKPSEGD